MKNSPPVFDLIKSLNKAEKRFFTLFASQNMKEGNSVYLDFFNYLNEQEVYDEEKIREYFAGAGFLKHLSATRHNLFKLLLRSLRQIHTGKTRDSHFRSQLENIELLYRKGLVLPARKLIRSTRKRATQEGKNRVLLDLIHLQRKLLFEGQTRDLEGSLERLGKEEQQILSGLKQEYELRDLHQRLLARAKVRSRAISPEASREIEEISVHPLLSGREVELPNLQEIYRSNTCGFLDLLRGNSAGAFDHFHHAASLWEAFPDLILEHLDVYQATRLNLLNTCILTGNTAAFASGLQPPGSLNRWPVLELVKFRSRQFQLGLMFHMNFGSFSDGEALIEEMGPFLDRFENRITESQAMGFKYNATLFFFLNDRPSEALRWLNRLLGHQKAESGKGMLQFGRVLEVVLFYEKKDFDLMEYRLRALERASRRNIELAAHEIAVLRFLRKGIWEGDLGYGNAVENLKEELRGLVPAGRPPAGFQELLFWVEAKVMQIPLGVYFRQKVAERS